MMQLHREAYATPTRLFLLSKFARRSGRNEGFGAVAMNKILSYVIVAETASSDQPFNCCLHLLDTLSGAIKALLCIYFNGAIDPFDSFPICSHECWVVKRPSKKFVLLSVKAEVCSTKLQTSSLPQGGSAAGSLDWCQL